MMTGIAVQEGKKTAFLTITDTGTGILPENASKITDPFFSTKPGKLGMGLAICRDIIEKHGGTLTLNNRPGGGTSASVSLPVAES